MTNRTKKKPRARSSDQPHGRLRRFLGLLGPGLITGASDDDPSGIATYAQAGTRFGFGFLWLALMTLPLMISVQRIIDRTALASGKSLGALAGERFSRWGRYLVGALFVALIGANMLNVAADLAAVGAGMHLLGAGPAWPWALVGGIAVTALIVRGTFTIVETVFKWLAVVLVAYVVVAFLVGPDWRSVLLATVKPSIHFDASHLSMLVAVLGTTISPYLFFWQSANRIEKRREKNPKTRRATPLKFAPLHIRRHEDLESTVDIVSGMTLSNVVMWAIILASAATIGKNGHAEINSAAEAAQALRPLAGRFASALFAFGLIGSGMLAVPVLAASGAVGLSGLIQKKWGFEYSVRRARFFYVVVGLGTLGGTLLSLLPVDVISLLVISALVNGVAAGPFLIVVMLISSDRTIMGRERNGHVATVLGWLTAAVMCASALVLARELL